jgi:Kef-type K+ transport system membrane component KefB
MITAKVLLAAGLVIVVVRLVGWLVARLGQPRVIGEIVAGILLGPSVLGLVWPQARELLFPPGVIAGFQVLAQFGLVLFMLLVGMELDSRLLRGQGRRSAVISLVSVTVPFGLGVGLGLLLHPQFGNGHGRVAFCLFIGAAISITAFPVLVRILQETGLYHTRVGAIAIACAAIDDVIAWCLLAVVVAAAGAGGPEEVAGHIAGTVVFVLFMVKVVRPLLARPPRLPLWVTLVVAFLSAWATEIIGIHAIFGAFLAGLVMPRRPEWQDQVRVRLTGVVDDFVLPMFFVVVGMSTHIDQLDSWQSAGVVVLATATAIAGKLGGATLAARAVRERWPVALSIGVLMNTRGLTEIVILTVGLQLGVIDTRLFTVLVIMALVTTAMAAPLLRLLSRSGAVSAATADRPHAGARR